MCMYGVCECGGIFLVLRPFLFCYTLMFTVRSLETKEFLYFKKQAQASHDLYSFLCYYWTWTSIPSSKLLLALDLAPDSLSNYQPCAPLSTTMRV